MMTLKTLFLTIMSVFVLVSCQKKSVKPKILAKFMLTYECTEQPCRLAELNVISYYDTNGNIKNTTDNSTNQFNVNSPITVQDIDLTKPISIFAYSVFSIGVEGGEYGVVDLKSGVYKLYFDGQLVDIKHVDAVTPSGNYWECGETEGLYCYNQ